MNCCNIQNSIKSLKAVGLFLLQEVNHFFFKFVEKNGNPSSSSGPCSPHRWEQGPESTLNVLDVPIEDLLLY